MTFPGFLSFLLPFLFSAAGWSSFIQGPLKVTKPEMAAAPAVSFYGHSNGWSPGTSESVWVLSCPGHFPWGSAVSGVGPRAPSQYLGTFCCTAQKTPHPHPSVLLQVFLRFWPVKWGTGTLEPVFLVPTISPFGSKESQRGACRTVWVH